MADGVSVRDLSRRYDDKAVLSGVSFSVADGEILALLGPSGCGKTTTLTLIAGLDKPDSGEIAIAGKTVFDAKTNLEPNQRGIGMVFQDQVLWPHLTVAGHLDFVLQAAGVPKADRAARIAAQLQAVRLTGRDEALPSELSGGERQRLSIARALVARPALLLLDEACMNLDAHLKHDFLALLLQLLQAQRFSALYVTHDAAEAALVASRIAVLDRGRIAQVGTPQALLENPATPAVAQVMGGGAVIPVMVKDNTVQSVFGPLGAGSTATHAYLRADQFDFNPTGPLGATVRSSRWDGRGWASLLERDGITLQAHTPQAFAPGSTVKFTLRTPPKLFAN